MEIRIGDLVLTNTFGAKHRHMTVLSQVQKLQSLCKENMRSTLAISKDGQNPVLLKPSDNAFPGLSISEPPNVITVSAAVKKEVENGFYMQFWLQHYLRRPDTTAYLALDARYSIGSGYINHPPEYMPMTLQEILCILHHNEKVVVRQLSSDMRLQDLGLVINRIESAFEKVVLDSPKSIEETGISFFTNLFVTAEALRRLLKTFYYAGFCTKQCKLELQHSIYCADQEMDVGLSVLKGLDLPLYRFYYEAAKLHGMDGYGHPFRPFKDRYKPENLFKYMD